MITSPQYLRDHLSQLSNTMNVREVFAGWLVFTWSAQQQGSKACTSCTQVITVTRRLEGTRRHNPQAYHSISSPICNASSRFTPAREHARSHISFAGFSIPSSSLTTNGSRYSSNFKSERTFSVHAWPYRIFSIIGTNGS